MTLSNALVICRLAELVSVLFHIRFVASSSI